MSQVFVIADARGDIQTCKECEPSPLRRQKAELAGLVAATSCDSSKERGDHPDADNGLQHDCFRVEGDHDRQGKHGDFSMKLLVSAALLLSLFGTASADSVVNMGKLRLADAATDACFASCASRSDACKRACPVTLNLPCLSSCDAQAQYCRQGCQR